MEYISSSEELEEVLKQHTGSRKAPYLLDWEVRQSRQHDTTRYFTYSRNRVTMLFKVDPPRSGLILLEVIPKIKRSGWHDGIDSNIYTMIEPYMNQGGHISVAYSGGLAVTMPGAIISEPEAIALMRVGFTEIRWNRLYNETSIIMK